jgi:hypothetical protein
MLSPTAEDCWKHTALLKVQVGRSSSATARPKLQRAFQVTTDSYFDLRCSPYVASACDRDPFKICTTRYSCTAMGQQQSAVEKRARDRASKESASVPSEHAIAGSALEDTAVLQHVLAFLGPGHHLFICASKQWRQASPLGRLYSTCSPRPRRSGLEWAFNMSAVSAAFATVSTISLAHACGLQLNSPYQSCISCFASKADVEVLAAAHELGMPYSDGLVYGVASGARLSTLRWLHTQRACSLPRYIDRYAAAGGCVNTLKWVQGKGIAFTADTVTHAARCRRLPALQFLYEQGCSLQDGGSACGLQQQGISKSCAGCAITGLLGTSTS